MLSRFLMAATALAVGLSLPATPCESASLSALRERGTLTASLRGK
jgi:hypothetical protein